MRIAVNYGRNRVELEADASRIIGGAQPADTGVADPSAAVRAALDTPFGYPSLRQALTPDDHVTVVVDESLPCLTQLLVPVLEHLASAGVAAEAVTLLTPPTTRGQPWIEELPDDFQEARIEVHDPSDRRRLSYLATTKGGRRLYLNHSLVEADQAVVLSARRYDPVLGFSGAEGSIFPTFTDEETRLSLGSHGRLAIPGDTLWPAAKEAIEAAWLLGAPFFVQVIEGSADGVAAIVAGAADASVEGRRRLAERWSQRVTKLADIVIAGISGDPARHTFAELAAAAACAARVVRSGGRIVLLSESSVEPGPAFDLLRGVDEPGELVARLGSSPTVEQIPLAHWVSAVEHAHVTLLSRLDDERVEELFATPLRNATQVQRFLDAGGFCLFLDDAHKAMIVCSEE